MSSHKIGNANSLSNKQPSELKHALSYSAPVVVTALLLGPLGILQGIYAKYFGLSLSAIAFALLIGRIVDAVSDPAVGFLSDKAYERKGNRSHFIAVGAILFVVSAYFLYVPTNIFGFGVSYTDSQDGIKVSETYFLFWIVMAYCSWTLFEIPHLAWGGDIAYTSNDKTRLYSIRSMFGALGGLLLFVIPYLPIFETTEITPQTLQLTILVAAILILPLIFISLRYTPKPYPAVPSLQATDDNEPMGLVLTLKSIAANRPFILFIVSFMLTGMGAGCSSVMTYIFIDSYLGLADKFPLIGIISAVISIPAIGLWYKLCGIFGKKQSWIIGLIGYIVCLVGYSQLTPENSPFVPLLGLSICSLVLLPAFGIASLSILSDIIDYGTLNSGKNQAGSYFSVFAFLVKTNAALGAALGLSVAGWYGFDASATTHHPDSIFGLHLSVVYIPVVFLLAAAVIVFFIPMNEKIHHEIRNRLDIREAEAKSTRQSNEEKSTASKIHTQNDSGDFIANSEI